MIRVPVMMMVIEMIIVMVKIAAMPVDTAPHPHSRATRHPHSRATSEGMSATTVAATVGGSCDQWSSERCRKKATQENYKF
ncbi:MAG: hypothetical protein DME53_04050 [Verrucomicrobia bacterium]|nr:MAG: hypothetical protein DME53_04050 [Verrucomicrobiota bacterium]